MRSVRIRWPWNKKSLAETVSDSGMDEQVAERATALREDIQDLLDLDRVYCIEPLVNVPRSSGGPVYEWRTDEIKARTDTP